MSRLLRSYASKLLLAVAFLGVSIPGAHSQTLLEFNGLFSTIASGFNNQSGTIVLSDGVTWEGTVTATGGGFSFVSRNGIGQISFTNAGTIVDYRFGTALGGEFQLDSVNLQVNVSTPLSITMEGYRDGSFVTGATEVINYSQNTPISVDVSGNAAFDNIDEIRFEFPSAPNLNGNLLLNRLIYSTAVASSPVAV
ncbi:MAG: hypothetical protein AAGB22_04160, partial [Bacteroidota bacterium]